MGFRYKDGKKVLRFSIRKYHFGAASVAIASLIFFGGMSAKAENIPTQQNSDKITNHSSSSGASKGDDGDSDADDKNISDKSIKIAKGELKKLSISLTTSIKATEKEKYSAIAKELDEILDEAKLVLDNKDAKLEKVNEQIKILTESVKKFDKTVEEANKKLEEKKAADQHKAEVTKKSDSQKTEEKKDNKATEKDGAELAENRPTETLKNDGTTAKIQQKEGATPKENVENPGKEKELPTYTNGADTDKLAEEINNISAYLSENGANATKVELLKSKYSKLKSKLEVAKNGVLSEEDFNAAVSDLKDARDTIAKFLADKQAGGTSENTPKIEAILNPVERRKETDRSSVTGLISEKKAKLARLQKEIEEKFGELNQINVASTEDIVKNANSLQNSITEALSSSQSSDDELDTLASQATRLRNSLANAIQRTHSGKRDLRNGSRMVRGADFRASYSRGDKEKVYNTNGNEALEYATNGYFTKQGDGSPYKPGTFLYASHNYNKPGNYTNPDLGPQEVRTLVNRVYAKVEPRTDGVKGYHWKITYNNGREPRQNPIYYFTIPTGQSVTNMTLKENGNVVKSGGVAQVFNGANDKYLTAVGSPETGVNGTPFYENVANVTSSVIGNRDSVKTLDDFVKNSTNPYFNRELMSESDIRVSDHLYEKIKSSTKNVFAFKPKDFDTGNTYEVEFDTVGDTDNPLYYIAGMKSYEKGGRGVFQHKSYQQWYGLQEQYNVTVNTNTLKTTFLKGTGLGNLDTSEGLKSGAVTITDTYNGNKEFRPQAGDVTGYRTFKPTGNPSYDNGYGYFHNRYDRDQGQDGINNTNDRTKGNHTLYIEANIKNVPIKLRIPYRIVTQSDIYEPVLKNISDTKQYKSDLGSASAYIESYRDVSNTIPGFKRPDRDDMDASKPYKNKIFDFPTTSDQIKDQSVRSTEWVGGSALSTGSRVIELTLKDNKKTLFTVPSTIDVLPGGKISAENVRKLNEEIRNTYQTFDEHGNLIGTVPTVTETTPVWVKKQIKVTYYDNENNARTNHQDDSVDYVDVLFKNIRKEVTPSAPRVDTPVDGSVSVTPTGTTDKLVVSYRPSGQSADKTITVKKEGTSWGVVGTRPSGITVDSSSGRVLISEPTVADNTQVRGVATYLNSDESSAIGMAKSPDTQAPTVMINGKALTTNAEDNKFVIFRGANFDPTFKVTDNSNNIRNFKIRDVPPGVWFNRQNNQDPAITSMSNNDNFHFSDKKVDDNAALGTKIASVDVSDAAGNSITYKFQYTIVDIKTKNSPAAVGVTDKLGDSHNYLEDTENGVHGRGDESFPGGMSWQWENANNEETFKTPGTVTKVAKAVFPPESRTSSGAKRGDVTIYAPESIKKTITFNVADNEKPQATLNGISLGTRAQEPDFTIFRGAIFNPELKVWDNSGKIKKIEISGLPSGISPRALSTEQTGKTEGNKYSQRLASGSVSSSETLGIKEATVKITGSNENDVSTFKFKYRVVDLNIANSTQNFDGFPAVSVPQGVALSKEDHPKNQDAHKFLSVIDDSSNVSRGDSYLPQGIRWKWKQNNGQDQYGEVLEKAGYYTKKVEADFTSTGEPINENSTTRRLFVPRTITRDIRLLVTPKAPVIEESQLYGQSGQKPEIEVSNIIRSTEVSATATRKVQLFSSLDSSAPLAEKTITDNTGISRFTAADYQAKRPNGLNANEQLYAKVVVTDQGRSVISDNGDARLVTERLNLSENANNRIVQANDTKLNDAEKRAIRIALRKANSTLNLNDDNIEISDSGAIVVTTSDKKRGWLQTNPNKDNGAGYVTRFANIRKDFLLENIEGTKLPNRDSDKGFVWAGTTTDPTVNGNRSLIYYYDATKGERFTLNDVLKTLTLKPKAGTNSVENPSLVEVNGGDKDKAENGREGFSKTSGTNEFKKGEDYINTLDLVERETLVGGKEVANTPRKLVETGKGGSNTVDTTLQNANLPEENGVQLPSLKNVPNGSNAIYKAQLYLRPEYVNPQALTKRGENKDTTTNVINVYFVPIDVEKPQVQRSSTNNLGVTEKFYDYLPKQGRPSFTSLVKLTDNYDKDDDTNANTNTLRSKLNMWLKTGNTKTQIVENGVEKTSVIDKLYQDATPTTVYELLAKTVDSSGNKSSEDNSDGTSLGFFKTQYPAVTYRKKDNQEVSRYSEIVGQPLTGAIYENGGHIRDTSEATEWYISFEGRKPNGTLIAFKDGALPDRSRREDIGTRTKTITVTYPNSVTIEKEITITTYGDEIAYENGKNRFETTVGKAFSKDRYRYVRPIDNTVTTGRGVYWNRNGQGSTTPVDNIEKKVGVYSGVINTWYNSILTARGDTATPSGHYSDQNLDVNFAVLPQAPTLNADTFRGKAGMKPTTTVGNLPTADQLGTDARVTVELYQGTNKVASKSVSRGTNSVDFSSADYPSNFTFVAGENVHAVVKVTGTTNGKAYDLSSANSTLARVTTTAPESPTISQNPEDLVVKATVGQGNSTNATLTYYDANNQAQNVEFTKTGNNWTKSNTNTNTNITITNAGVIELKAGVAKDGTNVSVKQRTETSEYSEPATKKVLGRLNGLTNTPKDDGSVEIIVPADATRMTLTYIPQGQTEAKKLEYTKNGTTWTTYPDTQTYSGERKIVIPKDKVADGTTVSAIASNDNSTTTTVVSKAKFEQPNPTTSNQRENGDVRITLPDNADTVAVTYKDKQNVAKSVTLTKGAGNQWTSGGNLPTGVMLTGNVLEIPYKTINSGENTIRTTSTRGEGDVRSQEVTQEFTADHRPPSIQAVVIAAGATPTDADLGRAVTLNNSSVTAKSTPTAVPAGTTVTISATLTYSDGSTEDIEVTVKSRPETPTVTKSRSDIQDGILDSTARSISGTASPNATVEITLQNGEKRRVTANGRGEWSYKLASTEVLNYTPDGYNDNRTDTLGVSATLVKVSQTVDGISSAEKEVKVYPGVPKVVGAVAAGRDINLEIPHDAYTVGVRIDGRTADIGITRGRDGNWRLVDAADAAAIELIPGTESTDSSRINLTLRLKNTNPAVTRYFSLRKGAEAVQARVHIPRGTDVWGRPASDWFKYEVINTLPTVNFKADNLIENGKVFASPTVEELKEYFEGHDVEDEAGKTVGYPATDKNKLRVRVFRDRDMSVNREGTSVSAVNNRIPAGNYTLVLSTRDAANEESPTLERNIIVKTYADFYKDRVIYPTNDDKVTYGNSDINNGNFTNEIKERFAAKIKEANANNRNLPTGVTYTKGTTDDKSRVAVINFPDGSTINISHTQVAKPTVPTFTATADDTHTPKLQDIDRIVKGTALQSATKVILKLQTGKEITIMKNSGKTPETLEPGESVLTDDGTWAYRLPNDTYLRQTDQTAEIGSSSLPVKVKQIVFDAESDFGEIRVAKERNFEGKTITGVKGSAELQALRDDAKKGIKYTEKNEVKDFPEDFTAVWKNNNKPDIMTVGRKEYTVELSETRTSSTVNHPGDRIVTVIVTEKAPQTLTYSQKQNGETEINIPTDADEVTFTIAKGNEPATTLVAKKSENWSLSNGLLTKSSDNKWKFGSHEDGTYTITAVATAGNGETKSAPTTTVITSNSHKVTKADIIKKPTDSWNGTDLYSATGVIGVIDNGITKTYQDAGITSVTSVGTLPELEPDTEKQVNVQITYNDGSQENTMVTLKVAPAVPNVTVNPQDGTTGDVTLTVKHHDNSNYPNDSVVTVPGIDGTFKVKDGKITIKNSQLKDTVQTGKVTVKEEGKLLVETEDNKVIPAKKVASAVPKFGEVSRDGETGDVTIPVTDQNGRALENGTKVTLPGVTGDHSVQDGKVVIKNNELPGEEQSGKGSIEETGKFPTKSTDDVIVPAKLTSAKGKSVINFKVEIPLPLVVPNPEHLTPKEITELENRVKKANPGKEVKVDDKGNVTVTDKNTGESTLIPVEDLTVKDFTPVKPEGKVPAKDKDHLTPEEKKQVEDKVKAKNPGKEVMVGEDGTVTVTDPTTGISHEIPGTDLVNQDFIPVMPKDKVPVKDPDNLTKEEQDKVKESVEKANPGKNVTIGKAGNVTITDPNTDISHEVPRENLITLAPPVVEIPEFNGGVNGELPEPAESPKVKLIITKWVDEQGNELKPADAKAPAVLGEANEAFEHGEFVGYVFVKTETKDDVVTHIFRKVTPTKPTKPEGNGEEQGEDNKPQPTPASPKVDENIKPESTVKVEKSTKRLANTGEAETNTGLAGLGLAVLGSLLAVTKRRKKDGE